MKGSNATVLSFAEKCKNILASNWQGHLNTIKADVRESKGIYTSKVKYVLRRGKPYIWVPEKEKHNVNIFIDDRASFSVTSPFPGALASLFRSIQKLPARVALTGDVLPLKDEKSAAECLEEVVLSEQKTISDFSYTVSGVLSSSDVYSTSQSENLKPLLDEHEKYRIYKFKPRSCMYIDINGGTHEVNLKDMDKSMDGLLAPFSANLIDGINQSEARRRALMLFCLTFLKANVKAISILLIIRLIDITHWLTDYTWLHVKNAYMLSIDCKGFDVLGMVPDGFGQYEWKEFRIKLKEVARDVETFCRQLVEMEEEAVKNVSRFSGLG